MTARRALPLAIPALALAGVTLLAAIAAASAPGSVSAFDRGVGVIAAVGLAVMAVVVRPALTLSVALVLSVFSNHWDLVGAPVALDRVALGLGIGSLLVREWRRGDGSLQTRPIDWLLMVVGLYALVSAVWAGTLSDAHARFTLIDRYGFVPFAMFFLAPIAFRTEKDRRMLLGALVGLGAYLGITALLETAGPRSLVVPHYITDQTVGIHQDRARGPFAEAVGNGVTMYFCAVAAGLAFIRWRSPRWRAFAVAVGLLCALGVLFTLTRSVWIGAGLGTVLVLLATRETRRWMLPVAAAGLALVLGALALVPGLQDRAQRRADDQLPLYDRKNSNAAAIRMIEAKPLLGFGWGRFPRDSAGYYRQSPDYPLSEVSDLHNVWLSNAAELGLVGVGLWTIGLIAAVGGAIIRRGPPALRPWKIGLIAMAACLFFAWSTAPSAYVAPTLLLWTWAGIAWGSPHVRD